MKVRKRVTDKPEKILETSETLRVSKREKSGQFCLHNSLILFSFHDKTARSIFINPVFVVLQRLFSTQNDRPLKSLPLSSTKNASLLARRFYELLCSFFSWSKSY